MEIDTAGIARVMNWANTPSPYTLPIGRDEDASIPSQTGMTNIQVLAKLIAINSFKAQVTSYGHFSGPFGLTQTEAHMLMESAPYFQGLVDGAGLGPETTGNVLEPELKAWADKFEAREAARIAAAAEAGANTEIAATESGGFVGPAGDAVAA